MGLYQPAERLMGDALNGRDCGVSLGTSDRSLPSV